MKCDQVDQTDQVLTNQIMTEQLNGERAKNHQVKTDRVITEQVMPDRISNAQVSCHENGPCGQDIASDRVGNLNIVDIIAKKRDSKELTRDEIDHFIAKATSGEITGAQIGAMLMAICLRDMTDQETGYLTQAMINSGEKLHYPLEWRGTIVGKHSTGGVGDKTSLVLVPALAACGLRVPKISGRGLGHTGGTLDKLEAVPGFRVTCTPEQITKYVEEAGCCLVAQTDCLVPADKVLYAIRDTTATVASIPLITGSIMSKKAVEGLDALVLELTFGRAAPIQTEEEARRLARTMIEASHPLGMRATAMLTRMDHPMGRMIGNSLEVVEAVECLNGGGPSDVTDLTCLLGGYLLHHVGRADSPADGATRMRHTLEDGSARDRFAAMLRAQGVRADHAKAVCEGGDATWAVLPASLYKTDLASLATGYISCIEAFTLADVLRRLGASREKPSEPINLAVGLQLFHHVGDAIRQGDTWIRVHHDHPLSSHIATEIQSALTVTTDPPSASATAKVADIIT